MSGKKYILSFMLIVGSGQESLMAMNPIQGPEQHGLDTERMGSIDLLFAAVTRGDTREVTRQLRLGRNVNTADSYGSTILILAALSGNIGMIKCLIDAGADVNVRNRTGWTALISITTVGACHIHTKHEILNLLIDAGAECKPEDLAKIRHQEMQAFLQDLGASRESSRYVLK